MFKPWLNISKYDTQFHIEIPLQGNIDSYWIDEAKSFLELKKKKYGLNRFLLWRLCTGTKSTTKCLKTNTTKNKHG